MTDLSSPAIASKGTTSLGGWGVRQKIAVGFGGLILLMAVGMGITLVKLGDIGNITHSVISERQPTAYLFQRLNQDLNLATTLLNGYLLTGEGDLRQKYELIEKDIVARLNKAQELATDKNSRIDGPQLRQAKTLFEQFTAYADELYQQRDDNTSNRGLILAEETLNPSAAAFSSTVNTLLASEDFDSTDPQVVSAYRKVQELRYIWVQMMSSLRLYINTQGAKFRANFDNYNNRAGELLDDLTAMDIDIGFGELEDLAGYRADYVSHLQPVLDIFASGNWRADAYLIKSEVRPLLDQLRQIFETMADSQLQAAIQSGQLLTEAQQQILITTFIILAVGLVLGGLIAVRMTNGIVPPIQRLMRAAQQVADGDLNAEVMVTTRDEIGQLGTSFNAMTDHLRLAALNELQMLDDLQSLNEELESRVQDRTKDLEQSETKIRAILDNIGEGIIVLNENGRIESLNPAAEHIFTLKEKDAIGVDSALLIADRDTTHFADVCSLFKTDSDRQPKEYQGMRSDGSTFPMELVVSGMNLGAKHMRVCIVRDITARKETEQQLANAQTQLVDAAHKSGMAEMATGVLHNIGNILNSVNLAGEEIHRIAAGSKISGLQKANNLLSQHQDNMSDFLCNDSRGQKLPSYYLKMGAVLNDEINHIRDESQALIEKTTMMKEVISTQQAYARSGFHSEQLNLAELIDDALKIQDSSLKKWGVKLRKHFADIPECVGQKSKLLQVITNLIKNAKEAMGNNDDFNKPKELTIETGLLNEHAAFIKVKDNGCGIDGEQLTKIFNHGFTTKQEGHGFGLHSSANAMTEMKGTLRVESEGLEKGACFTVAIPISKAA